MARPQTYTDDTRVGLSSPPFESGTRLNKNTERRAIINFIIDEGGTATLKSIDDHFGYDIRRTTSTMVRLGWLKIVEESE